MTKVINNHWHDVENGAWIDWERVTAWGYIMTQNLCKKHLCNYAHTTRYTTYT